MSADSYLPLTGFEKNGGVLLRDLKLPLSREKLQELTGDPRCFFRRFGTTSYECSFWAPINGRKLMGNWEALEVALWAPTYNW